jgi:hypothetical protein
MKYLIGFFGWIVVFCICSGGIAQNKMDEDKEASSHFKKGVSLFNEDKKEEAVAEFKTAYEIKPSWKIMYNIGQCQASLKRYGLAIEAFEKYLGEGGDEVPAERSDEVLKELDRLRKMVGSLRVIGPDGVEIYIDKILRGTTPLKASILETAGVEHWIWLIKDGKKLLSVQETFRGGETLELTVPPESGEGTKPPVLTDGPVPNDAGTGGAGGDTATTGAGTTTEPSTSTNGTSATTSDTARPSDGKKKLSPVIFIAAASAAVVFGGVAGGMAIAVNSKWEKSVQKINDNPWSTDAEAVAANIRTMHIIGYVSLGLAGAGVIAAAAVAPFTRWKKQAAPKKTEAPKKSSNLTILPFADGQNAGLVLEGRF